MAWFNFKRRQDVEKSMSDVYADLFKECEGLMDVSLKAAGLNYEEMLQDLDEETGALCGRLMESCRKLTNICAEQAGIIDRMESKIDAIQAQNETMMVNINKMLKTAKA